MTRIDRYILSEVSVPLILGFFVYTFILLIQVIFKSADLLVRSEASSSLVFKLFALSLPAIVVLTLPMALLFGILIGIGRLSADSEITALRASGLSLFTLYRPVAFLSLFIFAINLYLMVELLPRGNKAFSDLRANILEKAALSEIKPNAPNVVFGGRLLYIFGGETKDHQWSKVFIADSVASSENTAITADSGYAVPSAEGDSSLLVLKQAVSHRLDFAKAANYDLLLQDDYQIRLSTGFQGAAGVVKRSLRELSLVELRQRAASLDAEGKNLVSIEIQKRFGFPFACVVFGLVGLPLGIVGARSGRSAGFALSIGIIVVYYVLFNTGEESARNGSIPTWLAVWMPNLIFAVVGFVMLMARNSDSGGGYLEAIRKRLPAGLLPWRKVQEARAARLAAAGDAAVEPPKPKPNIKVRLARIQLSLLGNIDGYISFAFLRILMLCSLSLVAIFLIADLTENIEDFLRNEITADIIVSHYRSRILLIFYQISPIILLVATILTFALLARSNELVALRAIGLSFLRISAPVVLCGTLLAIGLYFMQSKVLPEMSRDANRTKEQIKKGKGTTSHVALGRDKQWIIGRDGKSVFNFLIFDESKMEIEKFQGFFFDENYRIASRFFAEKAKFLGDGSWLLTHGWKRDFNDNVISDFQKIEPMGRIRLAENPDFLRKGAIPPEEMNNRELKEYLHDLEASGRTNNDVTVAYGERYSYPLTALVMCLVALPFSFRYEKRGALYGVGFAIIIGFSLVIAIAFFKAAGVGGFLPPLLSVWIPPMLFAFFSVYLFLGVQS